MWLKRVATVTESMSRKKLIKFSQNWDRDNILEPGKPLYDEIKGRWNSHFFNNSNDICIELACGRGEYTTGLATVFPQKNFIGVDVKGDRLWYGSNVAINNNLQNVCFLRTQIQMLSVFFAEAEIAELWITFPDPRPRKRDAKRRLTHPRYLELYRSVLKPGGWVKFKTDNRQLFEYTLEVLQQVQVNDLQHTFDLYQSPLLAEHYQIQTRYERIFSGQGHKIHYLKFRFGQ